jgi:hypothetical protein
MIEKEYEFKEINFIFRFLGFNKAYQVKMIENPKPILDGFEYKLKLIACTYYWFNFKLKTVKL